MDIARREISKYLRDAADRFDANTSEIDEEQAIEIAILFAHVPISRETSARYLNMSNSMFDKNISKGTIPKGRKVSGWKEKRWYKDELKQLFKSKKH